MSEVHLFVDEVKLTQAVYKHFSDENLQVVIHPYEKLQSFLSDQVRQNVYEFQMFQNSSVVYNIEYCVQIKEACFKLSEKSNILICESEIAHLSSCGTRRKWLIRFTH